MGLIDKVINIKVIADKTIVIVVVKGRGRFARGEANQNNLCSGGREGGGGGGGSRKNNCGLLGGISIQADTMDHSDQRTLKLDVSQ